MLRRCAWLNHSSAPHEYMQLLADFPRVRAWFSGHFHLSHNYADSVVATGACTFVQTGVIGPHCNRDGERHSRLLRLSPERCKVLPSLLRHLQTVPAVPGPHMLASQAGSAPIPGLIARARSALCAGWTLGPWLMLACLAESATVFMLCRWEAGLLLGGWPAPAALPVAWPPASFMSPAAPGLL